MGSQSTVKKPKFENKENGKTKVWGPFIKLIAKAKLPYFWILLTIFIGLFQTKLGLLFPQYTQQILAGDISSAIVWTAVWIILGEALLSGIIEFLGEVTNAKITLSFRKSIWNQLIRLPVPFYDKNMPREMISRTTDDTTKLSGFFSKSIRIGITDAYALFGSLAIITSYDWRLGLSQVVFIILIILSRVFLAHLMFRLRALVQDNVADLTRSLAEILTNIPLVKTFVNEEKEEARGNNYIKRLFKTSVWANVVSGSTTWAQSMLSALQTVVVVIVGLSLISRDIITLDIWIAFLLYSRKISSSVTGLMALWGSIKGTQGSARRISQLSVEAIEEYEGSIDLKKEHTDITFENVSFKYSENTILDDVSFKIPKGKVTAIVGLSGAGKSTVVNLLQRFYIPNSGQIKHDNNPIEDYNLQGWRKLFGYVSQDIRLLSGTIRDNIIYGLERDVSDKEIEKAAEAAYALDFINSFEKGFDTEIGESGAKLSGGQRQRIAIARAILKEPDYLIFDEATSNLDAESEYMVDKALKRLTVGKTTIVIAHRLSTVIDADQIIVLDNREISGIGRHKDLLDSNDIYRKLMRMQLDAGLA